MKSLRIITITAALLALGACGTPDTPPPSAGKDGSEQSATNAYEVKDDVSVVDVDSQGGTIKVSVGSGTTIKVTEIQKYRSDKPGRKQSVEGGELVLASTGCPKSDCSISYELQIPSTLSLRLDSSGGAVTLNGMTGLIDVSTDGGPLSGEALAPPELTARTGGGLVELTLAQAPDRVEVDSGGANVNLRLPGSETYALQAELEGGKQAGTVKIDAGASHKLHVVTGGGNLTFA
ncbi:hypothetical protein ACFFX1_42385 [Dactylosporangium sucinum]|uniref:Adhesin domain-containing protein n=1 Tax=Dactylosporangium sucinum TaxID=1424081 RepID=A0A917U8J2_9ACTN|nr:hypothetical protein [Dactylosporangium sucinum]GGM62614.1 hypothetical protein GCM10007977_075260 [Dactylosporangium sucinum]